MRRVDNNRVRRAGPDSQHVENVKPSADIVEEAVDSEESPDRTLDYATPTSVAPAVVSIDKKGVLGNAAWTFGGFGLQQVVRFAAQLILARLLTPDAFGLVAFVFVIRDGLQMFSDIGLGQSLIQSKRTDRDFTRTAWTMQVLRGIGISALVAALAPVAVAIYGDPRLYWVMPLAAVTALIDGFASTSIYTHPRRMRVKGVSVVELVSQVAGSAAIVSYAYFIDRSVVALLVGGALMSLLRTIGSHLINRDSPDWFWWDRETVRQLFAFGRWILVSSILMFLASNVDRLILPKLLGSFVPFGVYSIALGIAMIPLQTILRVGIRVVFPVFSQTVNSGGDLRRAFGKARRFVVTGGGLSSAFFIGAGPAIITFLYPKDFHDAGLYLSILGAIIWLQTLDAANQAALVATGNTKASAISNLVKLGALLVGLFAGFHLGGLIGALVGIAIADLCKYLYSSAMNVRLGLPLVKTDLVATIFFAAVGLGLHYGFAGEPATTRMGNFIEVAVAGALSAMAAGVLFLWLRETPARS